MKHTAAVDLEHIRVPACDVMAARRFYERSLSATDLKSSLGVDSSSGCGSKILGWLGIRALQAVSDPLTAATIVR